MNAHTKLIEQKQSIKDAKNAIKTLTSVIELANGTNSNNINPEILGIIEQLEQLKNIDLNTVYQQNFVPNDSYLKSMPDVQNGSGSKIRGAAQRIQHVGISNFRLPVSFKTRGSSSLTLETSVTGSVSLEDNKKGINMSRIIRSFYKTANDIFSFDVITNAINMYKDDNHSLDARIQMKFSFPMKVTSLRSQLEGYQYYDIALEVVDADNELKKIIHLDYVYSSTCPCSLELAEHARSTRKQLATPHSQRSVARVSVEVDPKHPTLWFEDLVDLCRIAVPTETQVMVKREDEQAFAELNAANPIFVEDAVRSFAKSLNEDKRIKSYRVMASHQESLHSHDAISIITSGTTFTQKSWDPNSFKTLFHIG
ncbi:MAG: GTP cyclohydrolase FolE2 [Proteobacteria bacterium]|jgi:GTP cyclohydrolase I|nr:GTP cyclohydrolase FolE2 [Pseudomonadota bacterium]